MGSSMERKKHKNKPLPSLGPKKVNNTKRKKKKKKKKEKVKQSNVKSTENAKAKSKSKVVKDKELNDVIRFPTAAQQLKYFHEEYESANRVQLSSLELESFTETCMLELNPEQAQSNSALADHMKVAFGSSWKEILCEKELDGKIDPGQPALLVISLSALRSLDLLRELRPLTSECRAAKLFSKHMKIEEQASSLKNRINIASGTPSRDEFWDLYKNYFHQRIMEGALQICLYDEIPANIKRKKSDKDE
ncbi:uncharacterized protein LOC132068663 isoform X2 [Lycium ferocissimum]|uniref:uncharacterized protein LOC132068663 isoform X2 n=1 Tax=Lycium ferocissimum TaxID=112874 RepID=UPI0028155E3C|nr:uncharacterized protein LOC132068663 isoform X2 [Lycium ferocissimum]